MLRLGLSAVLVGGMIILAGCTPEPQANEAQLAVADVQGISFNDPAPSSQPQEPAVEDAAAGDEAALSTDANAQPADIATEPSAELAVTPATAESMPADIASIPSATPVPVADPAPAAEETTAETHQVDDPAPAKDVAVAAGEFQPVSFKVLSGFPYVETFPGDGQPADEPKKDQIPAEIKALDGKNAIVEGWMVPMEIAEDGSVRSFVLVKTQPQCCFGDMQAMNEWVDVTMQPGKSAEFNVDTPMKVYGQLEVGEKMEDGFVLSVYRMKAEKVEL